MTDILENQQYLTGTRSYLSTDYLLSSFTFAKRAKSIEENYSHEDNFKSVYLEHRSSVLGCILFIATFLESHINEFYSDISAKMAFNYPGIKTESAQILSLLWEHGIPRTAKYSIIEKFEFALKKLADSEFTKGTFPYQETQLLIKVRNSLIHYESEWVYNSPKNFGRIDLEHDLIKSLKGKFPLNPITGDGNPYFPDRCLGYGICRWGLIAATEFVLEFWRLANIVPHTNDSIRKINRTVHSI